MLHKLSGLLFGNIQKAGIKMERKFIEDDFDLAEFQRKFMYERDKLSKSGNGLMNERLMFKIISFFIMIAALVLGSFLYSFLARLIQKVHL